MMLKNCIEKLMQHQPLHVDEAKQVMLEILSEETNLYQVSAFLVLLRAKKEAVSEMLGMVHAMQQQMISIDINMPVLDIVGTGGDGAGTVNISTASAVLAASCGVKVVKHGNRSVSSLCGSADVLEALGLPLTLTVDQVTKCIQELGIAFCFAPHFHPSLQKLRTIRRELKVPTTLNLIAPLLNPARPEHYLLGVADKKMLPLLAEVLIQLGTRRSVIFHSEGLDELTCLGEVEITQLDDGQMKHYTIDPKSFGLSSCTKAELQGADAAYNAKIIRHTLSGEKTGLSDTLVLNAAMALFVANHHDSLSDAVAYAQSILASGKALALLDNFILFAKKLVGEK